MGILCALRHLPSLKESNQAESLHHMRNRLERGERSFSSKRISFLEGLPGSLALQIAIRHRQGDHEGVGTLLSRVGKFADRLNDVDDGECEVLYGRCGFLGAILFLRHELGDSKLLTEVASTVVAAVLDAGRQAAKGRWPLYYEWHGKCYFGGAHGFAGILFTLLQLPDELQRYRDGPSLVRAAADALLTHRFKSGNMPSSEGSYKDRLIHWCHGPTGCVPLLLKMAEFYRESQYLEIATQMSELICTRGLLCEKGPGLCHGIPGNGYAFLAMHRVCPGRGLWLRRARHFAVFAALHAEDLTTHADRPYSLFEGLAGALCFWKDVRRAEAAPQEAACFPAYEF